MLDEATNSAVAAMVVHVTIPRTIQTGRLDEMDQSCSNHTSDVGDTNTSSFWAVCLALFLIFGQNVFVVFDVGDENLSLLVTQVSTVASSVRHVAKSFQCLDQFEMSVMTDDS